jgi:hypothetical protein
MQIDEDGTARAKQPRFRKDRAPTILAFGEPCPTAHVVFTSRWVFPTWIWTIMIILSDHDDDEYAITFTRRRITVQDYQ